MPILSPLLENATPGDRARRRGVLCLLLALVTTPTTILLFFNLRPIWSSVVSLNGIAFALVAALFGAVLAIAPVITVAGWLLALWYGVESVFMQRTRRTPTIDIAIVGAGLVAWFSPALAFLASAVRALVSGRVHFPHPSRDYLMTEDPIAFWQGVGYMFIAAGVFAWLAWRYWQSKLRRKSGT